MTVDQVIGANVRGQCARRGITQTYLAGQMGLSVRTMNRKVAGDIAWMARDIAFVADFLRVEPGELFDRRGLEQLPHLDSNQKPADECRGIIRGGKRLAPRGGRWRAGRTWGWSRLRRRGIGNRGGMEDHGAPVGRYIDQQVRRGRLSEASARQRRYVLHAWCRYVEDWRDPGIDEVVDWVCEPASKDGKHGRESALRGWLAWCVARGLVTGESVAWVPTVHGSDKAPKPIPDDVLRRALARADSRDRDAMILGRFAGLRASEIAAVHREHLQGDALYVLGKGDKERWVALHPEVGQVVGGAAGFLFPSRAGAGHVQGQTMSRWLAGALPDPWTAHTLRHAFATELYAATLDIVLVAAQLGHTSVKTTERYVRVNDDRAAAAVAGMRLAS